MNSLQSLAQRVKRGDRVAALRLRDQLEQQMPYIVRRVIRTEAMTTDLEQRIWAEVDQLSDAGHEAVDREWLVEQVTQRICESMVGDLRPGWGSRPRALETVCN
jgi:hypothetical protein